MANFNCSKRFVFSNHITKWIRPDSPFELGGVAFSILLFLPVLFLPFLLFFPPSSIANSPMEEELLRRIMQSGGGGGGVGGGMEWERSYPHFPSALPANSPPSTPTPSTSSSSSILHSLPLHVVCLLSFISEKFNGQRISIPVVTDRQLT